MRNFLRTFIGLSIVLLALLVTAGSCDKDDKNNAGGGGGGGNGERPCTTTECLEFVTNTPRDYVKLVDKATIYLNANGLANRLGDLQDPLSSTDNSKRSFSEVVSANKAEYLFGVKYTGTGKTAMVFMNLGSVNTNNIALNAVSANCDNSGEKEDNTFANQAGGGLCRTYSPGGTLIGLTNYLGTVFNNPNTNSYARGTMMCVSLLSKKLVGSPNEVLGDNSILNDPDNTYCALGVINSGVKAAAEIDDNWVDTSAGSTTEVELYAIGIDITGKKISDIAKDLGFSFTAGNALTELSKAWSNAAIKSLLSKYDWRDLRFKVKIVKAADYTK